MKYINIYNTVQTYNIHEVSDLEKLPNFLVLVRENNKIYTKDKFIFHYKITDYMINNIQPTYNGKLPLVTRCDLFKRIRIDGVEADLSDKVREPYKFKTTSNDYLTFELGSLILTEQGFNENYVLTKHFDVPHEGIIELELNSGVDTLIGGFMFDLCFTTIDAKIFENIKSDNLMSLFSSCPQVSDIDLRYLNTNNVTNMFSMFGNCNDLIKIPTINFNTSNVTDMNSMFMSCNSLIDVDLTHFDTSKVTTMYSMFLNCHKLVTLDLSSFDTSNVVNMGSMFNGCNKIEKLYLDKFSIGKVEDKDNMFKYCDNLNYIRCTQSFKNWCITNQDTINLPQAMIDGTVGGVESGSNWEIVDYVEPSV